MKMKLPDKMNGKDFVRLVEIILKFIQFLLALYHGRKENARARALAHVRHYTDTPLYMCAKLRQSADRDVLKFQQMFSPEIGTKLSRCFRAGAWMRGRHVESGRHLPGRRRQPRKTAPSAPPAPVLAAFRYNLSRRGQEASTRRARGRSGQIA